MQNHKEDLTLETAKLKHVFKIMEMGFEKQGDIAKALGVSKRSVRNYLREIRLRGWEVKQGLLKNTDEEDEKEEIDEEIKFRFATNAERILYLDTKKRVR